MKDQTNRNLWRRKLMNNKKTILKSVRLICYKPLVIRRLI